MSVVKIINTDLNIGNKNILKNINFSISEGEMVFLIGRTGSGKTTFINSIFGNLEIEKSDKFNVLNYDLKKITENQIPFLRRKIGFVFQDFKLLNDRSIYDNLGFVLKSTGINDKEEINKNIQRVLKLVGINSSLDKFPNQLSGGEQQRVAIARSVLNNPELIIADEPTGNLDKESGINILNILKELNNQGKTVIMITHNQEHANMFKKVIELVDGKIVKNEKKKTKN